MKIKKTFSSSPAILAGGRGVAKNLIRTLTTFALLVGGVAVLSTPAWAEGEENKATGSALQISPTRISVPLQAGEVLEGNHKNCPSDLDAGCAIEVKNIGEKEFKYKVYASPYIESGLNGENVSFSEEDSTKYTQISRWITFQDATGKFAKEAEFTIAPGETQVVNFRIAIPEDVPGGSQYAAIWAQTTNRSSGTTGVDTISQAGMVVKGRSSGDARTTATISEYNFTRFSFGGALEAHAKFTNTGNTDFSGHYDYKVKTLFGKEIHSDTGAIAAYPENEYTVDVKWEDAPFIGFFQGTFRVTAADAVIDETHLIVILPIFVIVLFILLLTIAIVWIIIIIRKRKERKARALV